MLLECFLFIFAVSSNNTSIEMIKAKISLRRYPSSVCSHCFHGNPLSCSLFLFVILVCAQIQCCTAPLLFETSPTGTSQSRTKKSLFFLHQLMMFRSRFEPLMRLEIHFYQQTIQSFYNNFLNHYFVTFEHRRLLDVTFF